MRESSPCDADVAPYEMFAGTAATRTVSAGPDGPVNDGGVVSCTVHADAAAIAATNTARRVVAKDMALLIPKVAEVDLELPGHLDVVPGAIDADEGDARDRRQDRGARAQLHQGRLLF